MRRVPGKGGLSSRAASTAARRVLSSARLWRCWRRGWGAAGGRSSWASRVRRRQRRARAPSRALLMAGSGRSRRRTGGRGAAAGTRCQVLPTGMRRYRRGRQCGRRRQWRAPPPAGAGALPTEGGGEGQPGETPPTVQGGSVGGAANEGGGGGWGGGAPGDGERTPSQRAGGGSQDVTLLLGAAVWKAPPIGWKRGRLRQWRASAAAGV
jgi:hypothetical protein